MFYTDTSIYSITNDNIINNCAVLTTISRTNTDKPLGSCNVSVSTTNTYNYIYNMLSNYISEVLSLNVNTDVQINYSGVNLNLSTNTDDLMNNYTHYATFVSPDGTQIYILGLNDTATSLRVFINTGNSDVQVISTTTLDNSLTDYIMEWIDADINADGTRRLVMINKNGVDAKVVTIS